MNDTLAPTVSAAARTQFKPILGAALTVLVIIALVAHPLVASLSSEVTHGPLLLDGWVYAGRLAVAITFYLGGNLLLVGNCIARGFDRAILSEEHASGLLMAMIVPILAGLPAVFIFCMLLLPY